MRRFLVCSDGGESNEKTELCQHLLNKAAGEKPRKYGRYTYVRRRVADR